MSSQSRRAFFKNAATDAAVAGLLYAGARELRADPLGMPIGCQTYPVRKMIAQDFPGTIKQLADAGFQTIELCSPVGYADDGSAVSPNTKAQSCRKSSAIRASNARARTSASRNCARIKRTESPGQKMSA